MSKCPNNVTMQSTIMPVFTGKIAQPTFEVAINYGTAICIGPNIAITANHSVADPPEGQELIIVSPTKKHAMSGAQIRNVDRFEKIDIAIVETEHLFENRRECYWYDGKCKDGEDVLSLGFAHSANYLEFGSYHTKFYKGNIVSVVPHRYWGHPEVSEAYELSFGVPKGQSGGPLVVREFHEQSAVDTIIGVVIGNRRLEIEVEKERETVVEITKTMKEIEIVRTVEVSHYGIAVPTTEILGLHSDILGTTIRGYLDSRGLLVPFNT